MNDKRINVPIPEALKEAARLEAESQGESLSTYMRLALKEKLWNDQESATALAKRMAKSRPRAAKIDRDREASCEIRRMSRSAADHDAEA